LICDGLKRLHDLRRQIHAIASSAEDFLKDFCINQLIDQFLSGRRLDRQQSLHVAQPHHRLHKQFVNQPRQQRRCASRLNSRLKIPAQSIKKLDSLD
jgi:hypothetical protein